MYLSYPKPNGTLGYFNSTQVVSVDDGVVTDTSTVLMSNGTLIEIPISAAILIPLLEEAANSPTLVDI